MKKPQLITIAIIFVLVSGFFVYKAISDKKEPDLVYLRSEVAQKATPSPVPTEVPTPVPTEAPTPTPKKDVEKYTANSADYNGLARDGYGWDVRVTLNEQERDNVKIVVDSVIAKACTGLPEIVYYNPTDEVKTVYLTWDIAYENGSTAQILDILKEKDVKATFFLAATFINSTNKTEQELMARMIAEGHTIATRGDLNEGGMNGREVQGFVDTMWKMEENFQKVAGKTERMTLYRAGKVSARDTQLAADLGYTNVQYSYTMYQAGSDANAVKTNLLKNTYNGSIIDLQSNALCVSALASYIDAAEGLGYTFATLG